MLLLILSTPTLGYLGSGCMSYDYPKATEKIEQIYIFQCESRKGLPKCTQLEARLRNSK